MSRSRVHSSHIYGIEEEELDPRVQVELEKLNVATDEINRLESTLEEANNQFRLSLNETSSLLQTLAKRFGNCVDKSRPYYEAKERAKRLQLECQRAAVQYQRANAVHQAARETISLAEDRFSSSDTRDWSDRKFDSAWQEMLNHATMKIMEAEAQKTASEREHLRRAAAYTAAEKETQELYRKLKSNINKSQPYFNQRVSNQIQLEAQKNRIHKLQRDVSAAKLKYSLSLRNLEQISEEIHENRRMTMKREPGVGAEVDPLEDPFVESAVDNGSTKDDQYWQELRNKLDELKKIDAVPVVATNHEYSDESQSNGDAFSIFNREEGDHSLPYEILATNRVKQRETAFTKLHETFAPSVDHIHSAGNEHEDKVDAEYLDKLHSLSVASVNEKDKKVISSEMGSDEDHDYKPVDNAEPIVSVKIEVQKIEKVLSIDDCENRALKEPLVSDVLKGKDDIYADACKQETTSPSANLEATTLKIKCKDEPKPLSGGVIAIYHGGKETLQDIGEETSISSAQDSIEDNTFRDVLLNSS